MKKSLLFTTALVLTTLGAGCMPGTNNTNTAATNTVVNTNTSVVNQNTNSARLAATAKIKPYYFAVTTDAGTTVYEETLDTEAVEQFSFEPWGTGDQSASELTPFLTSGLNSVVSYNGTDQTFAYAAAGELGVGKPDAFEQVITSTAKNENIDGIPFRDWSASAMDDSILVLRAAAFSPNGRYIQIEGGMYEGSIGYLYDTQTKTVATVSADEDIAAVMGHALNWNPTNTKAVFTQGTDGYGTPGLYLVNADPLGQIDTVESTTDYTKPTKNFKSAVFATDNTLIYSYRWYGQDEKSLPDTSSHLVSYNLETKELKDIATGSSDFTVLYASVDSVLYKQDSAEGIDSYFMDDTVSGDHRLVAEFSSQTHAFQTYLPDSQLLVFNHLEDDVNELVFIDAVTGNTAYSSGNEAGSRVQFLGNVQ